MTTLTDVFAEFSKRLSPIGTPVIAGGAVRDHLMGRKAKDFDQFLLDTKFEAGTVATVLGSLADLEVLSPLEFHRSEPYLVVTVRWRDVDVQVMCNPATTVETLIDTFDWNVCLFAYDGEIHAREDVANIAPNKPLRLNKVTFPLSTLRRGFRFSERFEMVLTHEDALLLCLKVIEKKALPGPAGATPDMPSLAANALVDEMDGPFS